MVETLGQGSFGFVQLARNKAGKLAAIKVIRSGAHCLRFASSLARSS